MLYPNQLTSTLPMTAMTEPTKAGLAREIATQIRLYPEGNTTLGLLREHGAILMSKHPDLTDHTAVDMVQKALSLLTHKNYVRYDERNGKAPRTYYPTDKLLAQHGPEESTVGAQPSAQHLDEPPVGAQPPARPLENSVESDPPGDSINPSDESIEDEPPRGAQPSARPLGNIDSPSDMDPHNTPIPDPVKITQQFHDATMALADLCRWQDRQLRLYAKQLPDAPDIINAMGLAIDLLQPLRPDLADLLQKGQTYLQETTHA
jgi:hypothetical protein